MIKQVNILLLISVLITFSSCDYFHLKKTDKTEEMIASVGNKHLYRKDLLPLYNHSIGSEDSSLISQHFIENWAKKQIILQKAVLNISQKKERELNQMIDDYKDDLFINSYMEALVSQNMDTTIPPKKISDFYTANQNIFRLNEELVQFKELSFNTSGGLDTKVVKKLFKDSSLESTENLLTDELKFISMHLNDSTWVTYADLLKMYPYLKNRRKSDILHKNKFIEVQDSINTHYIFIHNFLNRNKIAPLSYVKPIIKQMILHKKKLKFIKEMEGKLIEEAIQDNIYIKY